MTLWFRTWRSLTFSLMLMVLLLTALQPSFTALADCGPNNICYTELYHDSRDPLYRTPSGPAPLNTDVTLRFRTAANDVAGVDLRVYNTKLAANSFNPMTKIYTDGVYDYWERTVSTGPTANILYYWFRINDGSATAYYEDDLASADFNHRAWGGTGVAVPSSSDRSWALTVYDPTFTTPEWVKNGIFYQIFPDRFRNGDSMNDLPAGEFFYDEAGGTIVRSLTSNWNTAICDPRADSNDGCEGSWSRNFYGGDLLGIEQQLDYLQDLGVNVIYMTPIFEAPSNHKYDARDFSIVDDNFGGDAALTSLVTAAHARGMYVVLDGVFNHVSSDSPYFDRYNQYAIDGACESTTSPYIDLFKPFTLTGSGAPPCSDGRYYNGWFGFDSLPEFDSQTPGGFARQAIWDGGIVHPADYTGDPGDPVKEIGTYWIDDFDIDGWRLDVANDVDGTGSLGTNDYWENFRDKVKASKSDAYIVGEFWGIGTQWISGGAAAGYTPTGTNPGEWDAVMNYQQTAMLMGFWRDSALEAENDFNPGSLPGKIVPFSPSMLATRYYDLKERYAPEAFYAMMNLNGSHDTQRALWLLDETVPNSPANGTAYPSAANHYEVGQPGAEAVQNLMGFTLMQYTLPGAPQIYYGTEVGLVNPAYYHGGKWEDDPYNRAPFPWGDETGTPYYTHMTDGNSVRDTLLDFFTALGEARNSHPALRTGEVTFSLVDDPSMQLGYYRHMPNGSDAAVVLINRGVSAASMTINLGQDVAVGADFVDAMTNASYTTTLDINGNTVLTVPSVAANTGILLVLNSGAYGVPSVPTLMLDSVSGTTVNLSWSNVGAATYNVYRSAFVGGGARVLVGDTSGTTFADTTVSPGVTYYYTVEAVSAGNVASAPSNEVSATPAYDLTGSYRNVQSPSSITHPISTTNPTGDIYGQIYIGGLTDTQPTPIDGLEAQVGYGDFGTNPSSDPSWVWVDAAPNAPAATGNNDEFMGNLLPNAQGTFSYTYRYTSDGGSTWFYAFDNPDNLCDEATHAGFVLCTLTVTASGDTTAPSAVTLTKAYDTPNSVGLSWTASTDDVAVQGYYVYRSDDGGTTYDLIATVNEPTLTYEDTSVAGNTSYMYYVVAFDTSFNESSDSNIVDAETVASPVNVTIQVTVPAFTRVSTAVQVIGDHPAITSWGAGLDMTETSPGVWEVTLSLNEGDVLNYKYRRDGTWDKVEKDPNGYDEILSGGNRQLVVGVAENGPYTVGETVVNWRDVLLVSTSIADGATDVPLASTFTATFNKTISGASTFTMVDNTMTPVAGTFSLSGDELSLTFTPTAPLVMGQTYTVTIDAGVDAAGDGARFFTDTVTFSTPVPIDISGSYRNVQSPSSLSHVVSAINRTDDVYGMIYLAGYTDVEPTPVAFLSAQLGYGDAGTNPSSDASWQWEDATPNAAAAGGNNDEFMASLLPDTPGSYSYTYRYSSDGGVTWFYAFDFPGELCDEATQPGYVLCPLTVLPSGDITPPSAVTLTLDYDYSSRVGLSWTASTDDVMLQGYYVYRSDDGGSSYNLIATLGSGDTSYEDTSVVPDMTYMYYVTAFDASLNESADSNIVTASTVAAPVNVTFQVTVPAYTRTSTAVQIIGNRGAFGEPFDPLTEWGAGANLTQVSPTLWEVTLNFNEGDVLEFKFRRDGSWDKVEKDVNGYDDPFGGANRFYTVPSAAGGPVIVPQTVVNWRDVLLVSTNIADGATDVPVNSVYTATFNKAVSDTSTFTVVDSTMTPVAGTFARSVDELSITFTPSAPLAYNETYTVTIDAGVDAAGDGDRFFSDTRTFTTEVFTVPVTFNVTVPAYTPAGATIYLAGDVAQLGNNAPDAIALTGGTVTVNLQDGATVTYFYSRGSTATRETGADNATFATHTITVSNGLVVNDTVLNWEDPLVVNTSPFDLATLVDVDGNIAVTFSKNVNFLQSFSVTGPGAVSVAGAFVYDAGTFTYNFDPDAALAYNTTYTVTVTGFVATDGALQQVSHTFTFTTEPAPITVTFNVTVPGFTPVGSVIYLTYDYVVDMIGGSETVAMTPTGTPNQYSVTLPFLATTEISYYYHRGTANTEETLADGETATNRMYTVAASPMTQTLNDTVENWRDPILVSHTPANGAVQQSVTTDVVLVFSKPIGAGTFTVVDSDNAAVAGSISLVGGSNTITFTPSAPGFRYADTITVTVADFPGFGTGIQVFPVTFVFETEGLELLSNGGFEADRVTFKPDPWKLRNGTNEKVKCNDVVPRFAVTYEGLCSFMFRSSNAENSYLTQVLTTSLADVPFAVGDELILSGYFSTPTKANMRMQLRVFYSDDTFDSVNLVIKGQGAYRKLTVPTITLTRTDVTRIRVQVRNLTKDGRKHRSWVDNVSLKLRQGDVVVRGGGGVAPLPLPDTFRGGN